MQKLKFVKFKAVKEVCFGDGGRDGMSVGSLVPLLHVYLLDHLTLQVIC
jgi:hypothetical protein